MDYYRATKKGWNLSQVTTENQIADWHEFYQELFGTELRGVTIPKRGADGLIMVASGLNFGQAYEACRKIFPCSATMNVAAVEATQNLRSSQNGSYALWAGAVSSETQKWNPEKPDSVLGTTLLEELLLRMMYYCKTGRQLEDGVDCLATRTIAPSQPRTYGVLRIGWEFNNLAIRWTGLSKKKAYSYRLVYL